MTQPTTFTVAELADELKLCKVTVRRRIASGEIPHIRIGRAIRIPATALDSILKTAS